ncbi:MAG: serine/threonine-protein kinase [Polyangia bacterium]
MQSGLGTRRPIETMTPARGIAVGSPISSAREPGLSGTYAPVSSRDSGSHPISSREAGSYSSSQVGPLSRTPIPTSRASATGSGPVMTSAPPVSSAREPLPPLRDPLPPLREPLPPPRELTGTSGLHSSLSSKDRDRDGPSGLREVGGASSGHFAALSTSGQHVAISARDAAAARETGQHAALAPRDSLLGAMVSDRYHLLSLLGKGSLAKVYLARHTHSNHLVAIKLLLKPNDSRERKAMQREAQLNAAVRHLHVVDVIDSGEDPRLGPYLVMPRLEGPTLAEVLAEGPLPLGDACLIAIALAEALDASHQANIVHRDVKPANVMLHRRPGQPEEVKLIDFGSARRLYTTDDTPLTLGDPSDYLAPEATSRAAIEPATDQYALGCILYEMLTGERPFASGEYSVRRWQVDSIPPPSRRCPPGTIPQAMDALVLRAIAPDPKNRFPTMRDMRRALFMLMPTQPSMRRVRSDRPPPSKK